METQLIFTYLIITGAVIYTLYHFVKLFLPQKSACGGSCGGCDFKKELRKRNLKPIYNK